jgi:hypothetical protein
MGMLWRREERRAVTGDAAASSPSSGGGSRIEEPLAVVAGASAAEWDVVGRRSMRLVMLENIYG